MPPRTKADLIALAADRGVSVDPHATKAQISDELEAAGVDLNEAPSSSSSSSAPKAGDAVSFTYKDSAENDVVRYGTVVELVDNINAHPGDGHTPGQPEQGARVAWLSDVSDPIPLDQLQTSR